MNSNKTASQRANPEGAKRNLASISPFFIVQDVQASISHYIERFGRGVAGWRCAKKCVTDPSNGHAITAESDGARLVAPRCRASVRSRRFSLAPTALAAQAGPTGLLQACQPLR